MTSESIFYLIGLLLGFVIGYYWRRYFAPAVKAVTVRVYETAGKKHGRWVVHTKIYPAYPDEIWVYVSCSECGMKKSVGRYNLQAWNEYISKQFKPDKQDFCHGCGADMRERRTDND